MKGVNNMKDNVKKTAQDSMVELIERIKKEESNFKVIVESIGYNAYFTLEDKEGYQVTVELGTPPLWVKSIAYKNIEVSGKRPGVVLNEERCKIDVFDHDKILNMINEAFAYAREF